MGTERNDRSGYHKTAIMSMVVSKKFLFGAPGTNPAQFLRFAQHGAYMHTRLTCPPHSLGTPGRSRTYILGLEVPCTIRCATGARAKRVRRGKSGVLSVELWGRQANGAGEVPCTTCPASSRARRGIGAGSVVSRRLRVGIPISASGGTSGLRGHTAMISLSHVSRHSWVCLFGGYDASKQRRFLLAPASYVAAIRWSVRITLGLIALPNFLRNQSAAMNNQVPLFIVYSVGRIGDRIPGRRSIIPAAVGERTIPEFPTVPFFRTQNSTKLLIGVCNFSMLVPLTSHFGPAKHARYNQDGCQKNNENISWHKESFWGG